MSYIVIIPGPHINSLCFENKDDAILYAINVIIDRINNSYMYNSHLDLFNLISAGKYQEAIERAYFVKIEEFKLRSFSNDVIKKYNELNKEMIFK